MDLSHNFWIDSGNKPGGNKLWKNFRTSDAKELPEFKDHENLERLRIKKRQLALDEKLNASLVRIEMSYMDINNASRIGVCGGVIVSQHHVLTAAHCFNIKPNLQNVTLMVGSHVNIAEKIDKDTKLKSLKNCTIHPSYIKGRPGNDLAILKIEGSFNLNEEPWLDKICLPQPETMIEKLGPNCYTLGWGLYDVMGTALEEE
ncbi:prostasin-like [Gordionus sp. m RMFG-2023]|uniref:prostasin-like n=1 Tax=Gordionus sp. m RMFG-2023 TaxID=3053472 RepID=UPI0031FD78C0